MNSVRFASDVNRFQSKALEGLPGKLILVSGPSGVGKGTIISRLFSDAEVKTQVDRIKSLTTRLPRPGEVVNSPGVLHKWMLWLQSQLKKLGVSCGKTSQNKPEQQQQYEFVSEDDFLKLKQRNQLLQWAHYDGNWYGSRLGDAVEKLKKGTHVLFELASKDALNLKNTYGSQVKTVFIAPPPTTVPGFENASTLDKELNTLRRRLVGRGTNSEESIQRRLTQAKSELALKPQFDHVIVNEDNQLDVAVSRLKQIILKPKSTPRFLGVKLQMDTTQLSPQGFENYIYSTA